MLTQERLTMMAENVARIRENMAAAAREAGRDPADILLCAACKTRTVEEVIASAALPIDLFGENHVQELVEKTDANAYCGKPGHFIGHLQTNKVNKVVGRAALIESVDSEHLLQKVERAAAAANLTQEILIEINIGGEESKSGVSAESLWPLLDMAAAQPHIRLRGLMAIPPAAATPDETRTFCGRSQAPQTSGRHSSLRIGSCLRFFVSSKLNNPRIRSCCSSERERHVAESDVPCVDAFELHVDSKEQIA